MEKSVQGNQQHAVLMWWAIEVRVHTPHTQIYIYHGGEWGSKETHGEEVADDSQLIEGDEASIDDHHCDDYGECQHTVSPHKVLQCGQQHMFEPLGYCPNATAM